MYLAITLAVKAKSRDERLDEKDEVDTLAAAKLGWAKLQAAGHAPDALAAIIYRPLKVNEASKAIAAQYAAHLVSTGEYGEDDTLFNKLPPYLQAALAHLTSAPTMKSAAAPVAPAGVAVPAAIAPPLPCAAEATPASVPVGAVTAVPSSPLPSGPTVPSAIPSVSNVPPAALSVAAQTAAVQPASLQASGAAAVTGTQGAGE